VNGAVPFGFEVDQAGFLVPSERVISGLGMTEADAVREMFRRVAEGQSCYAVAEWLGAAGVPSVRRLHSKEHHRTTDVSRDTRVGPYAGVWTNRRVWETIRNPVHKGMRTLRFGLSVVEQRDGIALVEPELWELANARMRTNNSRSGERDGWIYLLSNLIVCDAELPDGTRCGLHYTGGAANGYRYYACNGNDKLSVKRRGSRCCARGLRADKVEDALWSDLVWHVRHPEDSLEELRAFVGDRQQEQSKGAQEILALQQRRQELELARLALRRALREGKRPANEVEEDLVANADLIAVIQRNEERLVAALEVTDALDTRLSSTASLLRQLQAEIEDIEVRDDRSAKRRIIADLVGEIHVSDPRSRGPQLEVTYLFAPEGATQATSESGDLTGLRLQSGYSRTRGSRRRPAHGRSRCV